MENKTIIVWTFESNNDAEVVQHIAEKIIKFYGKEKEGIEVQSYGREEYRAVSKSNNSENVLKRQIKNYLKVSQCLIIIVDYDGNESNALRKRQLNSYITKANNIVLDPEFKDKVFLVIVKNEIEAWLLVDCLGIFCYYVVKKDDDKKICRDTSLTKPKIKKLIKDFQKGNTALIVEPVMGGKGAKEYLEKFTKDILQTLNPKLSQKQIDQHKDKYTENMSPKIAPFIEINDKTLGRNQSLSDFKDIILSHSCLQPT
jgi:hypothetical protein